MEKRCLNCMENYDETYEVCPHCGYIEGTPPKELYHLHPGMILHGRYIIGTVVGAGGFGVIYRVWDAKMEQMVAIKEFFPSGMVNRVPGDKNIIVYSGKSREQFDAGLERYLMEARNMASFSHPNIVNLFDFFEENNTAYIVMEYLDGISLKTYLKENGGKISCEETITITALILSALEEIHKHQIVHRDISPDNIFLCSNERVKLIDFGAARFSSGDKEEAHSIVLKPGFAPPEQYRGTSKQGPYTDLYALGATMYRCITGKMPEESLSRMIDDHLEEPIELVPDLPEHINNTILRSMALLIEYRFQNVTEFRDAMLGKKKVVPIQEVVQGRRKKHKGILAACFIGIVLLCMGAYYGAINYTRLVRVSNYKEKVNFYVPESKIEYFSKVETDFETDNKQENITIKSIPDDKYKDKVVKDMGTKDGPTLFFSDEFSLKELDHTENMNKYVVERLEDSKDNFYFLFDYYKEDEQGKKLPMNFNVPLILENSNIGKNLNEGKTGNEEKTVIKSAADFDGLVKNGKRKKKEVDSYIVNEEVGGLITQLGCDKSKYVTRADGEKAITTGKSAAFYITDWSDYKKIITDSPFIPIDIFYPDDSVHMNVELSNEISISKDVNIQARMIAEDFAVYIMNSQAAYIGNTFNKETENTDIASEELLPLNKRAVENFASIYSLKLAAPQSNVDGNKQFESYLEKCCYK